MVSFSIAPLYKQKVSENEVNVFIKADNNHPDIYAIRDFGKEWLKFNSFDEIEINKIASEYFDIVSSDHLNSNSLVLDIGCGSGRWSSYLSSKVGFIDAVDPSAAIFMAASQYKQLKNIRWSCADAENLPFPENSFDFALCLGVLHHTSDPLKSLKIISSKIKNGGFLLLYLYYKFDNRSWFYTFIFNCSNFFRKIISRLPFKVKSLLCDLLAIFVYLPFILSAKFCKWLLPNSSFYKKIPLSYYINKSFKIIRNDALDRFGTIVEKRYTKKEIGEFMTKAGFNDIVFSEKEPFWHAIGKKN